MTDKLKRQCCNCKDIQDDDGNWQESETLIRNVTHGYCDHCAAIQWDKIIATGGRIDEGGES